MGVFLQGGDGRGSERWKGQWERTRNAAPASHLTPHKGRQQAFGVSSDHREDSRVTSQRCFLDPCPLLLLQPLPSVPGASPHSYFGACLQISPVVTGFTGRPCFPVLHKYCISYKVKDCGNPVTSKSVSSIFSSNICSLLVSLSTSGNSHKILNFYYYFILC